MTIDEDRITGQVDFGSEVEARVQAAVELVNALAIGHAGGRVVVAPVDPEDVAARAGSALRDSSARVGELSTGEGQGLLALAQRLRAVFTALDGGRQDDAIDLLNALLADSQARPHLHRGSGGSVRLHLHPPDTPTVDGWTAGCGFGLAYLLGGGHAGRLGTCAAPACERVFLDVSRNGSRRFCGTGCQDRVKAAAYRARR